METKERENAAQDILLELLAIAFLATGGIFVRLSGLDPINTGFYRILFSLPLLLPLVYRQLGSLTKQDVGYLLLAGLFLAGDVALWNLSFSYTTIANANLLTNLTPLTVVPLSYLLFKEKIPRFFGMGLLLTLLGIFLLLGGKLALGSASYLGDLLAFTASFFYGGFLLIAYRLRDKIASSVIMFVSGIGTLVGLFFLAMAAEGVQVPHTLAELWPLLGLAICLQLVGHNLLAHCQGKVNVNLSAVVCLTQPVVAALYSLLLFGEKLALREILGIAVVIGGVYLVKLQYSQPTARKGAAEKR